MDFVNENIIELLASFRKSNSAINNQMSSLYCKSEFRQLSAQYTSHKERNFKLGFNLFSLMSKQYYKENLHSDMLKEILNPAGSHEEGVKYFELFLDYLNSNKKHISLSKADFTNIVVEREAARIDISVKDKISKKAIIIENKINNAPDMHRQIPRYYKKLVDEGFDVKMVVYLVLSGNKQPNVNDWSIKEIDEILPKTISVAAYDETHNDMYTAWLKLCEAESERIDTLFFFRQYNNLIKNLGGQQMNKPIMNEFLKSMLIDDNYQTAKGLKEMLDNLNDYRRDKIIDEYIDRAHPFIRVMKWNQVAVIDTYNEGNSSFAIDIVVESDSYKVQLFDRKFEETGGDFENGTNPIVPVVKELSISNDFYLKGNRMEKVFKFPSEEKQMYEFVDGLITKFRNRSQSNLVIPTT